MEILNPLTPLQEKIAHRATMKLFYVETVEQFLEICGPEDGSNPAILVEPIPILPGSMAAKSLAKKPDFAQS